MDGGADVDQGAQGLREPDAEQVHLEQGEVGALAAAVTHEQVVQGRPDPGGQAGRHVGPGQERDGDGGPGQQPGDPRGDQGDGQRVGQDVEALIVPVGQGGHAPRHGQGRPVVGPHVLVKPGQTWSYFNHTAVSLFFGLMDSPQDWVQISEMLLKTRLKINLE